MKNYLKHIDDFFREKLGRYSETPPADVWDSLEGRLDSLVPSAPQVPASALRLLKHFGIASLIGVMAIFVMQKMNNKDAAAEIAQNEQVAVTAATETPANTATESKSALASNDAPISTAAVTATKPVTANANKSSSTLPTVRNLSARNIKHSSKNRTPGKTILADEENAATEQLFQEQEDKRLSRNRSSMAIPGPAEEAEDNNLSVNTAAENQDKTQAALPKELNKEDLLAQQKNKDRNKPGRFEAGIKAGYERGFNDLAATKYALAPYVKYKLNGKFSILSQPAVKYATVNVHNVGKAQSYYTVNNDGTVTQKGNSTVTPVIVGGTIVDMHYTTTYTYSQSHDSVVKSYTHGGSYMEFELPLMMSYSVLPQLSVYGGLNINYSKQTAITEHTYTKKGIVKSIDSTSTTSGAAVPLALSDVITYGGYTYSDYKAPVYTNTQSSSVKLGYMIGFSYEYSHKWLFDALMQQTPVKPYLQGGYNVNSTLSAPYFRLSVGYKLTK